MKNSILIIMLFIGLAKGSTQNSSVSLKLDIINYILNTDSINLIYYAQIYNQEIILVKNNFFIGNTKKSWQGFEILKYSEQEFYAFMKNKTHEKRIAVFIDSVTLNKKEVEMYISIGLVNGGKRKRKMELLKGYSLTIAYDELFDNQKS